MKTHKLLYTIFLIIITLILVFAGNKIKFYIFDATMSNVEMKLQKNTKSTVDGQILWFSYDKKNINLNINALLDSTKINIYSLTAAGSSQLENSGSIALKSEHTGSYLAVAPAMRFDINSDGKKETVNVAAKTDTQLTQGFVPINTKFSIEKFPFEMVLTNKTNITVFYKGTPLANQKISVSSINTPNKLLTTSANGELPKIDIRDLRKGLNLQYVNEEGVYYILSYQVEENTLFNTRYLSAMLPFILILIISTVLILVIIILRNLGIIKTTLKGRQLSNNKELGLRLHFKFLLSLIKKAILSINITFSKVRWFTMIASFILLIFGLHILGIKITSFTIPVFACPINTDQFIASPCYELCHLNTYLKGNLKEIITFFVTLIVVIVILGRSVCGFVCPLGFLQDLMFKLRDILKINNFPINEKIYSILNVLKWFMLVVFFGICTLGINFCDFCPAIIVSPAFAGFKTSLFISGFIGVIFFVTSFFKNRIWCNICPLGYFIGLFNKISLFRLRKNCQSCTECGACYEACPMGIKSIYTERKKENITTCDCIMCGECVKKCPENDAIALAVLKKKFYVASRFKFFNQKKKRKSIKMPFFNKEL